MTRSSHQPSAVSRQPEKAGGNGGSADVSGKEESYKAASPGLSVYARWMTSFRTRATTRLVSAIGVRRKLQELADSYGDQTRFERLIEKTRRYDRRDPPSRLIKQMRHELIDVEGHELHVFNNPSGGGGRLILYLHGGGYMFGPFPTEWKMASSLAADSGSDLAVFLYPRTPEHGAEHTVQVTLTAYQTLLDQQSVSEIVLIGTSAGGGLSVVLMAQAARLNMQPPSRAVLISPGVDMALNDDVHGLEAGDVFLSPDYVRLAGRLYADSRGVDHQWVSPTNGDLDALPPLQVFAGSREILKPSIETFVERARAAGSSAQLIVGEGQQHAWPTMSTPEGQQARAAMSAFVEREGP